MLNTATFSILSYAVRVAKTAPLNIDNSSELRRMARQLRKAKTIWLLITTKKKSKNDVKHLIDKDQSNKTKVIQFTEVKKKSASVQATRALLEQAKQLGW